MVFIKHHFSNFFLEAPAVQLTGKNYMMFDTSTNPHLDWRDEISIRFKTTSREGLLLATNFQNDILLIELHEGSIYMIIKLAGGKHKIVSTLSVQNFACIKFGDWQILDFWREFNLAIQNIGQIWCGLNLANRKIC